MRFTCRTDKPKSCNKSDIALQSISSIQEPTFNSLRLESESMMFVGDASNILDSGTDQGSEFDLLLYAPVDWTELP